MKKRWLLIGSAALTLGAGLAWLISPPLRVLGYRTLLITGHSETQRWSLDRLQSMGPPGIAALGAIGSDPAEDRMLRLEALYRARENQERFWPAVPALLNAAVSDDEELRDQVESHLCAIELGPKDVAGWIPILRNAEIDPVRRAVAGLKIGMSPYVTDGEDITALRAQIGQPAPLSCVALRALRHRSSASIAAIPDFTERLRSGDDRERRLAAEGLGEVVRYALYETPAPARAAIQALAQALRDDGSWRVRARAAEALGRIGEKSAPVIEDLRAAARDPARAVRREALLSLAGLAPSAELVAPLLRVLETETGQGRSEIFWSIGSLGPEAASAVPALRAFLQAQPRDDEGWVISALEGIGPAASAASPELTMVFDASTANPDWASNVARALWSVAPEDQVLAAMVQRLGDPDPAVRQIAIAGLHHAPDHKARAAVPALVQALDDKDEYVRFSARDVLAELGPAAALAVPRLMRRLDPESIRVLGLIGPKASAAVPLLLEACKDRELRFPAAEAIARIDPSRAPVAVLIEAFRETEDDFGLQMVEVEVETLLKDIDPRRLSPALIAAMSSPEEGLRLAAGHAALSLQNLPPDLVPTLIKTLDREDEETFPLAIELLRRLGSEARAAAPILRRLQDSRNEETRLRAAIALAFIGPSDPALLPALNSEPMVRDDDLALLSAFARIRSGADAGRELQRIRAATGFFFYVEPADLQSLSDLKPAFATVISALRERLRSGDLQDRRFALHQLTELGAEASTAASDLIAILEDSQIQPELRTAAAEALGSMGVSAPLIRLLESPGDQSLHASALAGLARAGRRGRSAAPQVRALLKDPKLHGQALRALLSIDPQSAGALVPELLAIERAGWFPDGELLVDAVRALGDQARLLAPGLARALSDPKAERRWSAAELLYVLGPRGAAAAPALVAAIPREEAPTLRLAMVDALIAIEAEAELVRPVLESLEKDESDAVRLAASRFLEAD